ncbi:MAG TPA: hypothetical protein VGG23_10390, partial [Acidimicrobiales bacterium]
MTDTADTTDVAGSPAGTPPVSPPPDAAGPAGPAGPAPGRRRPRSKVRLLVVFAVLVGAVVFLLVEGLGSSLDYFDTV